MCIDVRTPRCLEPPVESRRRFPDRREQTTSPSLTAPSLALFSAKLNLLSPGLRSIGRILNTGMSCYASGLHEIENVNSHWIMEVKQLGSRLAFGWETVHVLKSAL